MKKMIYTKIFHPPKFTRLPHPLKTPPGRKSKSEKTNTVAGGTANKKMEPGLLRNVVTWRACAQTGYGFSFLRCKKSGSVIREKIKRTSRYHRCKPIQAKF